MAPRDRQRFRERFRREPRVEANGGGGEETYENPGFIAACSTAQTNRPEVNVRSNPLFDRATTGHPLCGPAAFESPDKSFNPFPPQRGGGGVAPLFPGPSLARNSCSLSEPVLSSSGKNYWDGSIFGWFLMMRSSRNKYGEMDLEWLLREIG